MAQPDRAGHRRRRALSPTDTIFALSSGAPPAAIAIIRISGPSACRAVETLAGRLPAPRTATLRTLRNAAGDILDAALVLVFPAATSATGEDLVELHCHGGRAVIHAVDEALAAIPGLRRAEGGEFTRRALLNGKVDLAQAEALGDLLRAETESERRAAIAGVEGAVSRLIAHWQDELTALSAQVEAVIDYDEEGDVTGGAVLLTEVGDRMAALRTEMIAAAEAPTVERLRDGVRVVLAGPRNAGKSTLFNLLAGREAAIVSPIAGTTRDRIEAPVQRGGKAYLLIDTAGLAEQTDDPIEALGIARTAAAITAADIVLWLGDTPPATANALWLWSRADLPERHRVPELAFPINRNDRVALDLLWRRIDKRAMGDFQPRLPVLNSRQHGIVEAASRHLAATNDPVVIAEQLRLARRELGGACNAVAVDAMLDVLFNQFCVGK